MTKTNGFPEPPERHVMSVRRVEAKPVDNHQIWELELRRLQEEYKILQLQNERLTERVQGHPVYPKRIAALYTTSTETQSNTDARINELEQKLQCVEKDNAKLNRLLIKADNGCRCLRQQLEGEEKRFVVDLQSSQESQSLREMQQHAISERDVMLYEINSYKCYIR